jgi:hypothetical protein
MTCNVKLNADLWEKLNGIAKAVRGDDHFFGIQFLNRKGNLFR